MNARQAYKQILKASKVIAYGWVINNLLGLVSILLSIYFVWWKWNMGLLGIIVSFFIIWFINGLLLPKIFQIINIPFEKKAVNGAETLISLGVISSSTIINKTIYTWPKYIVQNLTEENIKLICDQNKIGSKE